MNSPQDAHPAANFSSYLLCEWDGKTVSCFSQISLTWKIQNEFPWKLCSQLQPQTHLFQWKELMQSGLPIDGKQVYKNSLQKQMCCHHLQNRWRAWWMLCPHSLIAQMQRQACAPPRHTHLPCHYSKWVFLMVQCCTGATWKRQAVQWGYPQWRKSLQVRSFWGSYTRGKSKKPWMHPVPSILKLRVKLWKKPYVKGKQRGWII